MKQSYILFVILISVIHTHTNTTISTLIPKNIPIYPMTDSNYHANANNCDMATNGEQFIARSFIKFDDIVFDIGANKGDWSMYALSVHPDIFLYAFEPIPATFETLKRTITSVNTILFNIAVSSDNAFKDFFFYDKNVRLSKLSSLHRRSAEVEKRFNMTPKKLSIPTMNLDTICLEESLSHIDFLKIDTEGAELEILYGATNLLKNEAISIIQFEYGGTYQDAEITLEKVYRLLARHNYAIFRIIPKGLIHIAQWDPRLENYQYSNYLAVLQK